VNLNPTKIRRASGMTKKRNFQLEACGGTGFFAVFSRAVRDPGLFSKDDRDQFRRLLRANEKFAGVRIVTWTLVSNYFRLLVEVTEQEPLDEEGVKKRCRAIYAKPAMEVVDAEFAQAHRIGKKAVAEVIEKYERRMGSLPEFVKTLKQKFSKYYNREHQRRGVFWESRFESLLIEPSWDTISIVAAYIDLAAVREREVEDPQDYDWCGYAEAVSGTKAARLGYASAFEMEYEGANWKTIHEVYHEVLFGDGEIENSRKQWTPSALAKALDHPRDMSLQQLLRCHVRYFDSGLVIGHEDFVEQFFEISREAFADDRETGGRKMIGSRWGGLYTVRQLRDPISVPV
jgi:putative transposase